MAGHADRWEETDKKLLQITTEETWIWGLYKAGLDIVPFMLIATELNNIRKLLKTQVLTLQIVCAWMYHQYKKDSGHTALPCP